MSDSLAGPFASGPDDVVAHGDPRPGKFVPAAWAKTKDADTKVKRAISGDDRRRR
jgi:hypothetical protein